MFWVTFAIQNPEAVIWTVTKISIIGTIAGWFLGAIGAGPQAKFIRILTTLGAVILVAYQIIDLYKELKGL